MAKHSDGEKRGKFCAKRKTPCDDGEHHQNNCFPDGANAPRAPVDREVPEAWAEMAFKERSKSRGYEAHHLLCVASVTEIILGATGDMADIVDQTEWCINRSMNMVALPLWGHTLMEYCEINSRNISLMTRLKDAPSEPHFSGLPQHDYSHNLYIKEVKEALNDVLNEVNAAPHDEKTGYLHGELDYWSRHFRDELERRGSTRNGGTHSSWLGALKGDNLDDWHRPFSMANDGLEPHRHFPGAGGRSTTLNKLRKLVGYFTD